MKYKLNALGYIMKWTMKAPRNDNEYVLNMLGKDNEIGNENAWIW